MSTICKLRQSENEIYMSISTNGRLHKYNPTVWRKVIFFPRLFYVGGFIRRVRDEWHDRSSVPWLMKAVESVTLLQEQSPTLAQQCNTKYKIQNLQNSKRETWAEGILLFVKEELFQERSWHGPRMKNQYDHPQWIICSLRYLSGKFHTVASAFKLTTLAIFINRS